MTSDPSNPGNQTTGFRPRLANPVLLGAGFVLLILGILCLPLGGVRTWVCRSPWVYLPFRFVLALLAGLPALVWIRRGNANTWLKIYLVLLALVLVVSPTLLAFMLIFGFGPALRYQPLGISLPFIVALVLLIKTANSVLRAKNQTQMSAIVVPVVMFAGMLVIGYLALAVPPNTYPEYAAYLSRKYGRAVTIRDQHLLERSAARPVAGAPAPPPGLAFKYLVFGERAIDYSALLD